MLNHEMKLDDKSLLDSINLDYIGRNRKLNKLMELVNSFPSNQVIAIDGGWGTGKTVFVRQLHYLNQERNINNLKENIRLDKNIIGEFQKKYVCHYYNAWEYDFHSSPLLSLIYNIIKSNPTYKNNIATGKVKFPVNIYTFLNNATAGLLDKDCNVSYEDLYREISSLEDTKESLNLLIEKVVPKEKKLLLIIDEIDRCKPSYSVELLEIIKHFFDNEKIVFLISTNNKELANVIKNYYGSNFDGYGYLNKFYDLIITMDEISPTLYLQNVLKVPNDDYYYPQIIYAVCNYFRFTMRGINRIMSDFELLENYFSTSYGGIFSDNIMVKYVFLPYCLGLKMKSHDELNDFINGNGLEKLIEYVNRMYEIRNIIINEYLKNKNPEENDVNNIIKAEYEKYYVNNNFDKVKQMFFDTLSLLGGYSEIFK